MPNPLLRVEVGHAPVVCTKAPYRLLSQVLLYGHRYEAMKWLKVKTAVTEKTTTQWTNDVGYCLSLTQYYF